MGIEESYERDRRYFYDAANDDHQVHKTYVDEWGNVRVNVVHYGPVPPPFFPKAGQVYAHYCSSENPNF